MAADEPADAAALKNTLGSRSSGPVFDLPTFGLQAAAQAQAGNPLWAVPLRALTATRDRPLFSPTRRPPPAPVIGTPVIAVPAPAPAEPDHPMLTLLGTVVGASESIGIFVDQSNKQIIRLRVGQENDGWTLRAVHERNAVFEHRKREAIVALPARSSTDQIANPMPSPIAASPGTWMDGDGRMISPPVPAKGRQSTPRAVPAAATWRDGDGRLITPPMARN